MRISTYLETNGEQFKVGDVVTLKTRHYTFMKCKIIDISARNFVRVEYRDDNYTERKIAHICLDHIIAIVYY